MTLVSSNKLLLLFEHFLKNYAQNPVYPHLILSSKNEIEFVSIEDIIFCEADGFYTKFHLENKKEVLVTKNLKEYENVLPSYFFRIHKSYLINCLKIKKIIKAEKGRVIMLNGTEIPI